MLILSRRVNEEIVIGDDCRVIVIEITPVRVRLGVEAPRSVEVHRSEVAESIRRHGRRRTYQRE